MPVTPFQQIFGIYALIVTVLVLFSLFFSAWVWPAWEW
jgi:hypothetical protein